MSYYENEINSIIKQEICDLIDVPINEYNTWKKQFISFGNELTRCFRTIESSQAFSYAYQRLQLWKCDPGTLGSWFVSQKYINRYELLSHRLIRDTKEFYYIEHLYFQTRDLMQREKVLWQMEYQMDDDMPFSDEQKQLLDCYQTLANFYLEKTQNIFNKTYPEYSYQSNVLVKKPKNNKGNK